MLIDLIVSSVFLWCVVY